MSDILKEAIADAKAVRETALQNAKMALEEAFAPHLKNMLSAKLSEEEVEEAMHDEEEEAMHGDEEEAMHGDEEEEGVYEMEDEEEEAMHGDEEEGMHKEEMDDDEEEEGMHKEEMDDEEEEGMHKDEELDLEAIIKELEAEINEEEDDEDKEEMEENDVSSGIGSSDNKQPGEANQSSKIGNAKNESVEEEIEEAMDDEEEESNCEDVDTSDAPKISEIQSELDEYKEAVEFLQDKLHEVNVLNAKLLFTNKLFKEYALDKDQKVKVVETMDRAQTTREIKLVYSTLAEAFSQAGKITRKQTVKESASAPVGSTKPKKKIISEETKVADRFKKLAGII